MNDLAELFAALADHPRRPVPFPPGKRVARQTHCVLCGKELPQGDLSKVALLFHRDGAVAGWGCGAHSIDLPREILRSVKRVRCARCGLSMRDDHGIGSNNVSWCRDGGPFLKADDCDLGPDGEIDRSKHSTAIIEITLYPSPLERAA